ncbi:sarcinarray family MAST domain-containing protein [Methanohalophilus sp. RSK]|uniref:sarcinarray family MAST domain-containing protein n=1 Tax=Methanohalophilus sp. RSK TaxID=2485783 RepID=UPI000F43ABDE|nr:sarcinarray family MAST domain-containing protein [Methanohalophilus sp. RSK]RNI11794.1 sarcinarray family MAST domain-containing protein [Methanohalophilus sp. RSK]
MSDKILPRIRNTDRYILRLLCVFLIITVCFSTGVLANDSYAVTEVYCNGELYPEHFTPSPVLDANESFSLTVEMTVKQASVVDITLNQHISDSGTSLEIQAGSCVFNSTHSREFAPNETFTYKWILREAENTACGPAPVEFHYSNNPLNSPELTVEKSFIAVTPHVTDECVDDEIWDDNYPLSVNSYIPRSKSSSGFTFVGFVSPFFAFAIVGVILLHRKNE